MNIKTEFVPLEKLVNSLGSHRRTYFLYRQAAESGTRGARLRFQWYRKSLDKRQLKEVEALFKTSGYNGTPL